MTKPLETLQRIPLAKLYVAPENARFGAQDLGDLDALAASIVEVGDLIDPLHAYADADGQFGVWDGGRRWHALMKLVKGKKTSLPDALAAGVPVLVSESQAAAMMLSQATFTREAMHPADEFLHYKRMLDGGVDPQRIAAACAVSAPRVRQLLRLVGVAPAILDAFRGGAMALDAVEAFTLTEDHARQLACFEALSQRKSWNAYDVKSCLRKQAMGATDTWAVFVGVEAYTAAGGGFLQDLFSGDKDPDWADGDLARSLAQQKLNAMIADLEADGWAFVEFVPRGTYTAWNKGRVQTRGPWSKDARPQLGVFIVQGWNGEMDVKKGWAKPDRSTDASGAPVEKPDPALYGWGHKGHGLMTQVATEATRVALIRNPEAALDAMLTHVAWIALASYPREGTASRLTEEQRNGQPPAVEVDGSGEWDAAREGWKARLGGFTPNRYGEVTPETRLAFCDAVAALSSDEKMALLAFSFGDSLWAFEDKNTYRAAARWAHLGWMARRAGVDLVKAWTPGADFLKGASKDALLGAVQELNDGGKIVNAKGWANCKKGELVEFVARRAKEVGWIPKLLRDLVAPPAAPEPASKPAKDKGRKAAAEALGAALEPQEAASEPDALDDPDALSPAVMALATGSARPIPEPDDGDDA